MFKFLKDVEFEFIGGEKTIDHDSLGDYRSILRGNFIVVVMNEIVTNDAIE